MPKLFPCVHVRNVYFDYRCGHRTDGILQRYAVMGVCAGVENDSVTGKTSLVDFINQLTLTVGLEVRQFHIRIMPAKTFEIVFERPVAIDGGLTLSQQVQVGPINNFNSHITKIQLKISIFAKIGKITDMTKTTPLLKGYHDYLKLEKSLSGNTVEAYTNDLEKLLIYLGDIGKDVTDVTLPDLETFMASLVDIGISARSQMRIISGIRSFYKYLVMEEYLKQDPTELLEAPKLGRHLPEVLTIREIDEMEGCIDLSKQEGTRNHTILELLYSCGLRVSELCNLTMSDLYLEEGYIRVTGKGDKQRLVPISGRAVNELDNWFADRCHIEPKKGQEDYVFLSFRLRKKLSRISIFHIIKVLAAEAGISKVVSPHTFRHSFATHLLEGGANLRAIQEMLGHAYIDTTEIYTHISQQTLRKEILEHHPRNIRYRAMHQGKIS